VGATRPEENLKIIRRTNAKARKASPPSGQFATHARQMDKNASVLSQVRRVHLHQPHQTSKGVELQKFIECPTIINRQGTADMRNLINYLSKKAGEKYKQ